MSDATKTTAVSDRTIAHFGEQWTNFRDNDGYYGSTALFADMCAPLLASEEVRGRRVADIGSGTGRIVRMLVAAGAVLPETGNRTFKRLWFRLDAGRFPRSRASLRSILASRGRIDREDLIGGPLHDCAYFRVEKPRGPRCDSP